MDTISSCSPTAPLSIIFYYHIIEPGLGIVAFPAYHRKLGALRQDNDRFFQYVFHQAEQDTIRISLVVMSFRLLVFQKTSNDDGF